jgi:hypothetical protein
MTRFRIIVNLDEGTTELGAKELTREIMNDYDDVVDATLTDLD